VFGHCCSLILFVLAPKALAHHIQLFFFASDFVWLSDIATWGIIYLVCHFLASQNLNLTWARDQTAPQSQSIMYYAQLESRSHQTGSVLRWYNIDMLSQTCKEPIIYYHRHNKIFVPTSWNSIPEMTQPGNLRESTWIYDAVKHSMWQKHLKIPFGWFPQSSCNTVQLY